MMNQFPVTRFADRILPAPVDGGFALPDDWVWCGSCIRGDEGRYHLFAARWPRSMPFFLGYQAYSEIVRAVSDTPAGPYRFAEVVLPDRGGDFWDGRMTHNPTVLRWGGQYVLFYIGSTFHGPKPSAAELRAWKEPGLPCYRGIRIGVATADSPAGPWRRRDQPFLNIRPDNWDRTVVTNPSPCLAPDGRLLLYYRTNTPQGCRIGLAIFRDLDRPCVWRSDAPVLEVAGLPMEDPFIWWAGDHYEMIAKDLNGRVTGAFGNGLHALSADGLHWELAPSPVAYSRTLQWNDGRTETVGCFERPQLLLQDGVPTHLFAAVADGPGGFNAATRTWNAVVPLKGGG